MNKLKTMLMAGAALFGAAQAWGATVDVSTWAQLKEHLEAGNSVKLAANITQTSDKITPTTEVTLDLNGKTLTQTGTWWVFAPRTSTGKLTVKDSASGGKIVGSGSTVNGNGGCVNIQNSGTFVLESGTISGFKATSGGAIYNEGAFTMNGGTITGCQASDKGGAICNTGTAMINGGRISDCSVSNVTRDFTHGGGAIYNGGEVTINGGTFDGNKATTYACGGVLYCAYGKTVTINDGMFTNNVCELCGTVTYGKDASGNLVINGGEFAYNSGYRDTFQNILTMTGGSIHDNENSDSNRDDLWLGAGSAISGGYIAGDDIYLSGGSKFITGGVFDRSPTSSYLADNYECAQVGGNYVTGKLIAYDSNNKLTAGTYTFCPTNVEYVAAGVEVSGEKILAVNESVTPKTWTITSYNVETDPASTYKPTQIVNGSFDTEPWMNYTWGGIHYTSCPYSGSGELDRKGVTNKEFHGVGGGWNTTETDGWRGNLFEYVNPNHCQNTHNANIPMSDLYIEMNCYNAAVLYQDLKTYSGDVIRWTLKHGVVTSTAADETQSLRVEIGAPKLDSSGNLVNASGIGSAVNSQIQSDSLAIFRNTGVTDSAGSSSTIGFAGSNIANLSLSKSSQANGWYTASGVYVIPEDQSISRFAFVSEAATPNRGNVLDDLTFSTLIGNLKALVNDDGSVTITGYWGDSDTSKNLMIKIGDAEAESVSMANVVNTNFAITVSSDKIGSANSLEIYHQDYESAKRTVTIGYAVTLNLNADDAKCTKLETYQRGVVTVLPIPTRTGYAFKGWFENAELTGTAVTQIEADATGAKTFYAKWQGPLIQVGDDAWAWVTNGLCEVTGTTATWDFTTTANPLDDYWRAITNIVVCDGVTELGAYTFYKFYNATNITFAASVTNLCAGALFRCLSFENVTFEGPLPTMEDDNALVIHAGIKMEGGKPVVYAVPNVTVNGESLTLKGSNDLQNWEDATGNEGAYHFFKFVAE